MQPRNAAILLLVAVVLGAFVYLYEIEGGAKREAEESESRRLFPALEADAIAFLAFRTRDDRAFEAVREDGGWLLQSPIVFAGDAVGLDAMTSALANLETEETIESPGAPEIYGLGEAARWVRFRVGSETHGLAIGADTPVGGNVYVARQGSDAIHTVPAFRVNSFDRDLSELRDKRVFDFDRTRVERIVVGWPGGSVTVERANPEVGTWQVAHPTHAKGPADDATIDGLLSDLAFLRADDFLDEGDPAIDGEAFVTVRLGLAPAEGAALEVGLRAVPDPNSEDFLVRGASGTTLFRVARGRLSELPRDVFAYRFKQISRFEVADARAFEVELADPLAETSAEPLRIRVERGESGWQAEGAAWRPGKAGGLMAEFARLEGVAVLAEEATAEALAEAELEPPRVRLRAFGEKDAATGEAPLLADVALGRRIAGVGIAARAVGQTAIYAIDESLADSLPMDLERFEADFLAGEAEPPPPEAP